MNESRRVILLEMGAATAAVAACLQDNGWRAELGKAPLERYLLEPPTGVEAVVIAASALLGDGERLQRPAPEAPRAQGDGAGEPPVVVALGFGDPGAMMERARALADAVVDWQAAGQAQLLRCIEHAGRQRSLRQEARLRRQHAQVLSELVDHLSACEELQVLLPDALSRLCDATDARSALLLAFREEQPTFYVMADSDDAQAARLPVARDDYPEAAEVIATGRELLLDSIGARGWELESCEESALLDALRERGLQQLLVTPLVWEGMPFGVLELGFDSAEPLSEPMLELIRVATGLLAYALRCSDLYRSLGEQTKTTAVGSAEEQEAVRKYKEFFQRAFDGIVVLDRDHTILHINPAGEQVTGYARRGLVGRSIADIVVEEDRALLARVLQQVSQEGAGRGFDLGLVTTSGDRILVSVSPSAVLTDTDIVVLSFRDVTESRALEEQLRSTKEFLERLIDSTVDAIVVTDMAGVVILFNKGAERIFGMKSDHVCGKLALRDLFPRGEDEKALEQLRSLKYGGKGRLEAARLEVLSAGGERVPVSVSANVLYDEDQEGGLVAIISDLRERLLMEQRLAQAQEKLIESEKQALIAELAGTTAHELNQPLTSVMGYAELLDRRIPLDDSNHRAVSVILRETERMAEIVRKIGRITRYETKNYVGSTQILDLEKSSE